MNTSDPMTKEFLIGTFSATLVVSLISIVGNCLVISANLSLVKKSIVTLTKVHLAGTSLVCSISLVAYSIDVLLETKTLQKLGFDHYWLYYSFLLSCQGCSFYIVSLMALERLCAIRWPYLYRRITKNTQTILILGIYLLQVPEFIWQRFEWGKPTINSVLCWKISIGMFTYSYFLPLAITIICTFAMVATYLNHSKGNFKDVDDTVITRSKHAHWRPVRVTTWITFGYIVTCTPYLVTYVIYYAETRVTDALAVAFRYATTWNILIGLSDVVTYCFLDDNFTQHAKRIILKVCPSLMLKPKKIESSQHSFSIMVETRAPES